MVNSIKQIYYHNINILSMIDEVIYCLRSQNYRHALDQSIKIIDQTSHMLNQLFQSKEYFNNEYDMVHEETIICLLKGLLEAQDDNDYVLLADLYEIQFGPFILRLQEYIVSREKLIFDEEQYIMNIQNLEEIDKSMKGSIPKSFNLQKLNEQGYLAEYSSSGLITLALIDKDKKYYMHSNNKIRNEAYVLAKSWLREDKTKYIIYGLGLGYHVEELIQLNNNIRIEVYESDLNIIQLACAFGNMDFISQNSNIRLVYDPDYNKILKRLKTIDTDTEFVIHYPSLKNIKNPKMKEVFEDYFLQYSSINNQIHYLNDNFAENINHYNMNVDELKIKFEGMNLYIVAAGPSLDNNYMQLKNLNSNSIILATGTVLRKLLNAGIQPDYVIISDATPGVYEQIRGLESANIPLIFLSTAYKEISKNYLGKKIIVFQNGFLQSESYASERGFQEYKTGGSVSTIALELGIRLGCKKIIFLGLDLAYTNNSLHAKETSGEKLYHTDNLRRVEGIHGDVVSTSKNLDIYRKWIENRIRDIEDIEFIDATEGGAKIAGMKIMKLEDCLNL